MTREPSGLNSGLTLSLPPPVAIGHEGAGEVGRHLCDLGDRAVGLELGGVPLFRQGLAVDFEDLFDRRLVRGLTTSRGPEHQTHDIVTVFPTDIGPERVAVAIGEVARVVQIVDFRQPLAPGSFAHPHGRMRIDGPQRQVFSHTLDEPKRQRQGAS